MSAHKEIFDGWCKVDGTQIQDLKAYVLEQFAARKASKFNEKHDLVIQIGTDSMVKSDAKKYRAKRVSYMTVIVFKKGNNGCHIIKRREDVSASGFVPTAVKLNGEINRTAALAFWMRETLNVDPEIHLDLNTNENFGSYEVYKYIRGYFESLKFKISYKPEAASASNAADHYL